MKRLIGAIKDLFYNLTDFSMIIVVFLVIATVLVWRFNILFNLDITKDAIEPVHVAGNDDVTDDTTQKPDSDDIAGEPTDVTDNGSTDVGTNIDDNEQPSDNIDTENPDETTDHQPGIEVSFTIPQGTFPSAIADILLENGLITDKQDFLTRSIELDLDTRLKSGDFTIETGTELDEVIEIIAR